MNSMKYEQGDYSTAKVGDVVMLSSTKVSGTGTQDKMIVRENSVSISEVKEVITVQKDSQGWYLRFKTNLDTDVEMRLWLGVGNALHKWMVKNMELLEEK